MNSIKTLKEQINKDTTVFNTVEITSRNRIQT